MANEETFIEESFIEETLGKKNPYRVPEGYFDRFAEQLLSKLPEQPVAAESQATPVNRQAAMPSRRNRMKILRPILVAAACLCIAIFSITFYLNRTAQVAEESYISAAANTNNDTVDEEYMDEAADYVMLDNADIYACLSENER